MMSHHLLRRKQNFRRNLCTSGRFGFVSSSLLRCTTTTTFTSTTTKTLPASLFAFPSSSIPEHNDDGGRYLISCYFKSWEQKKRRGMTSTGAAAALDRYDPLVFLSSSIYCCRFMLTGTDVQTQRTFSDTSIRSFSTWEGYGRNKRSLAIERNHKLESLGRQGHWKEILDLYKKESEDFDYINYATMFVQLGRISYSSDKTNPIDTTDPIFQSYLNDLATKLETKGFKWMEIRQISNIINSIGKLGLRSNQSVKRIIEFTIKPENAKAIIKGGDMREISLICWGIATVEDKESFKKFYCHQVEPQLHKLVMDESKNVSPQVFSHLAYACAESDVLSLKLFTLIEKGAVWLIENSIKNYDGAGGAQPVSNVSWATSVKFGIYSPSLFENVEKNAGWLVANEGTQGVANTALAFATQGRPSKKFFDSLMNNVDMFLFNAENQHIINLCYSIAILDLAKTYKEGFLMLWSKALSLDPKHVTAEVWTQLAQSYVFVTASGMKLHEPKLPTDLDLKLSSTSSRSQREVSRALTEIGFEHQVEVSPFEIKGDEGTPFLLPPGMLPIDCACAKRKIAIEFDGPSHFLINLPKGDASEKVNGPTKAKRQFLKRLGWKVYSIHYNDWARFNEMAPEKGKKAKHAMLRSMLNL